MAFIDQLVTYIGSNTTLTVDTDLFLGAYIVDSPMGSVSVVESSGGRENETGLISQPIQVLCKNKDYVSARTMIMLVHDLIAGKAGFSAVDNVFYCENVGFPNFVSRTPDGGYVFTADYVCRRR